MTPPTPDAIASSARLRWQPTVEVLLIVAICFVQAGSPPPAKNEPHYLGKARQYWQPEWCQGDFFLESADAHEVFYWTFGWITQFTSLETAAWCGRVLTWLMFAIAWRMLVVRLTPTRWAALVSAIILLPAIHYGHLSGEWLIGGVEAKGFAYPFVFAGIAKAIERRWWSVWPLLGIASSFHILVGGWAVLACLVAWCYRRREDNLEFSELAVWLVLGGICALPGLVPALQLTAQSSPEEIREANITYAFRRLSHHLIFYRFKLGRIVSFVALIGAWVLAMHWAARTDRMLRLKAIVIGSLTIATTGVFLDCALSPFNSLRAAVMRYYWFRLSDILVPTGFALASVVALEHRRLTNQTFAFVAVIGAALGIGMNLGHEGFLARSTALQQQNWKTFTERLDGFDADEAWRDVCEWIRSQSELAQGSVFLTPTQQQTFKWYAQRPDVVTWKDVPQDAAGLNAWWKRRQEVHLLGDWPWMQPDQLANIVSQYGVTHVVWPILPEKNVPSNVVELYRNDLFGVFALPQTR